MKKNGLMFISTELCVTLTKNSGLAGMCIWRNYLFVIVHLIVLFIIIMTSQ